MNTPSQTPFVLKTCGYLISSFSVIALGVAAWPGAADADLLAWLVAGMIASIAGMVFRWSSYYLDKRRAEREQARTKASPPGTRPVPGPV
jgi:heme/copper-type cytochrome/quinol oxidase subunit 2